MQNVSISKLFIKCSVILFGLFLGNSFAFAQTTENILDYHVDLHINADSSVNVVESINYDYASNPHHGIFRDIVYKYQARGGTFKLRISNVSVTSPDLGNVPVKTSTSGDLFHLQIGDANTTVTGSHVYNIAYTVNRAINYFDTYDELYWNAIGGNWQVFIQKSSVSITLPGEVKPTQVACFHGSSQVSGENCRIDNLNIASLTPLGNGLGLTIVVGVPKGIITKPTWLTEVKYILQDNWILGLPLVVLIYAFSQWWRKGRDPKGKTTVVPQYEPPAGLSPLQIGIIRDEKVDKPEVVAEIIYLAEQGYLTITRKETKTLGVFTSVDYDLEKTTKDFQKELNPISKQMMEALFDSEKLITLSSLKTNITFGKAINKLQESAYGSVVSGGYFKKGPQKVRAAWSGSGIFVGIILAWLLSKFYGGYGTLSGILSGVIMFIFGFFMPVRTVKGVEMKAYIEGLKNYLTVAEKDRLAFHNAPEKNPKHFEHLLPFAVALGVADQWANQFKDIPMNAPSWYRDDTGIGFNPILFTSSINSFSSSFSSASSSSTSSASSGGSGFSGGGGGGGFGGGGGGSW